MLQVNPQTRGDQIRLVLKQAISIANLWGVVHPQWWAVPTLRGFVNGGRCPPYAPQGLWMGGRDGSRTAPGGLNIFFICAMSEIQIAIAIGIAIDFDPDSDPDSDLWAMPTP